MRALLSTQLFDVRRGGHAANLLRGCLVRWLPVGAAIVVAACGGNGGDGGSASASQSSDGAAVAYGTGPYSQLVPAQPLTLAVEVDSARAVTQRVTAAQGGILRATDAAGATFELTVPADALAADVEVTMTPIGRFTRLPFNGSDAATAWGVQLDPSGTRFLKSARLRITPPPGVAVALEQQLAFGWEGNAVQLALFDPASPEVDLQVLHFSGYALGRFAAQVDGANAALQNLRDRLGPTPERRMETVAAERTAAKRREALTGKPDPYQISADDFRNYFDGYLDGVVRPRIEVSGGCANSRVAFETVLNVQNTLRTLNESPLSWEPYRTSQTEELMKQVAEACLTIEYTRCASDHAVTDIITAVQGIDAEARRIAVDPWSADWKLWRARAEERLSQCHRYRLEVDSTSGSDASGSEGWRFSERMEGLVDLHLSGPVLEFSEPIGVKTFQIVGAGEIPSRNYSIGYPDSCSVAAEVIQASTLFSVSRLAFARSRDGSLGDLRLEYFPGSNASSHLLIGNCSDPPTQVRLPLFAWFNTFLVSVGSDDRYFDPNTVGFFLDHWIMDTQPILGGEKTLATHVFESVLANGSITYRTVMNMRVVHTPIR
jgi:hypothetical protein